MPCIVYLVDFSTLPFITDKYVGPISFDYFFFWLCERIFASTCVRAYFLISIFAFTQSVCVFLFFFFCGVLRNFFLLALHIFLSLNCQQISKHCFLNIFFIAGSNAYYISAASRITIY